MVRFADEHGWDNWKGKDPSDGREHLAQGYITFRVPDGGFAVWITFMKGIDPMRVAENASEMGLTISSGKDYYHDKTNWQPSIRLGFASLNSQELFEAVMLLKKAIFKLS